MKILISLFALTIFLSSKNSQSEELATEQLPKLDFATYTCPDCNFMMDFIHDNLSILKSTPNENLEDLENLETIYLIVREANKNQDFNCASNEVYFQKNLTSLIPSDFVLSFDKKLKLNDNLISQLKLEKGKESIIIKKIKLGSEDAFLRIDTNANGESNIFWYKKISLNPPTPPSILPPAIEIRKANIGIEPSVDYMGKKSISAGMRTHFQNGIENEVSEIGYTISDKNQEWKPYISESYSSSLSGFKFNFTGNKLLEGDEYKTLLSNSYSNNIFTTNISTAQSKDENGVSNKTNSQLIRLNQQDFSIDLTNSDSTSNGQKTNIQSETIVFRPIKCNQKNPITKQDECKNNGTEFQVTLSKITNDHFLSKSTDLKAKFDGYEANYNRNKGNYLDATKIKLTITKNNGEIISLSQEIDKSFQQTTRTRNLNYSSKSIIINAAQVNEHDENNYVLTLTKPINQNSKASISYDTKGELDLNLDINYGQGTQNSRMPSQN